MLKKLKTFVAVCALLASGSASAGLLVVSGDSNIVNILNDPTFGNQQFFENVLSGGSNVAVLANGTLPGFDTDVDDFYNSLAGVTSNIFAGAVTAGALAGADLFVSILPDDNFTAAEVAVLDAFLAGGGNAILMGENQSPVFDTGNAAINQLVSDLGGTMQIVGPTFDGGFHTTNNIAADPLTAGVADIRYAAPSELAVLGGTLLVSGANNAEPFIAYEDLGAQAAPEPGTALLIGLGLLGFALRKRQG